MSVNTFTHEFTGPFKGKSEIHLGSYIDGKWTKGGSGKMIDIYNPSTGKVMTQIHEATAQDVDAAVDAAAKAFKTSWGLNVPGSKRGHMLMKLADLIDKHQDELASIEALDNGKPFTFAKYADLRGAIDTIRYYAGWADKSHGNVIETNESKFTYTRHEPIGVVGQIIPWNFPLLMFSWKIGPALATGNCIVLKPSEMTSLSALRCIDLIEEAGFPPGVVNIVLGYGNTVGARIAAHPKIDKVAFTGSTLVGREILKSSAGSNLKNITLELGGKSPTIVFDDCEMEQTVKWVAQGLFFNSGQVCCAGTRIFVQSGIYKTFLEKFTEHAKNIQLGDPFETKTYQGPQVSQTQFDRIMGFIDSGKKEGANLHLGGSKANVQGGENGYFIQPTIFTNIKPGMKIVQEEIFGPVGVIAQFDTEEDIINMANDTVYGLAAAVYSKDISRAISVAHKIQAGTVWVNHQGPLEASVPFGGYKQSGIGRELGEEAISNYTNVKSVHVNLSMKM